MAIAMKKNTGSSNSQEISGLPRLEVAVWKLWVDIAMKVCLLNPFQPGSKHLQTQKLAKGQPVHGASWCIVSWLPRKRLRVSPKRFWVLWFQRFQVLSDKQMPA